MAKTASTNDAKKVDNQAQAAAMGTRIHLNAAGLKSTYANVCDVKCTREEVYLNFGVTKPWEQNPAEVEIELSNRLVMSPFAAKRLLLVLGQRIGEFEKLFGELRLTPIQGSSEAVGAATPMSKDEGKSIN